MVEPTAGTAAGRSRERSRERGGKRIGYLRRLVTFRDAFRSETLDFHATLAAVVGLPFALVGPSD